MCYLDLGSSVSIEPLTKKFSSYVKLLGKQALLAECIFHSILHLQTKGQFCSDAILFMKKKKKCQIFLSQFSSRLVANCSIGY